MVAAKHCLRVSSFLLALGPLSLHALLDDDDNGLSDVWEHLHHIRFLDPDSDLDGDGLSNREEARLGSDPLDPRSGMFLRLGPSAPPGLHWNALPGIRYTVEQTDRLSSSWVNVYTSPDMADGIEQYELPAFSDALFLRLRIEYSDTDSDGLEDWEEQLVGFDPDTRYTDRWHQDDDDRVRNALRSPNIISVAALDDTTREDWPDSAILAVRRSGGLDAVRVTLDWSGSATAGVDYAVQPTTVDFAVGQNLALIEIDAIPDDIEEGDETIQISVSPKTGYTARLTPAVLRLIDKPATGLPGPEEAGRFLTQATFGPNSADLAEVQALGFEGWIDAQFGRELGLHQPILEAWESEYYLGADQKMVAWWHNAMEAPDPLRQRVAFALSEIFVISDADGALRGRPLGMANYYDMLVRNAFGNFRDLLLGVSLHPCMGRYLSHVQNMAAAPDGSRFPDENYAREIMQLFTIGLWELNPDGTPVLDDEGTSIPTFTNADIRELARVFTGLNYEGNNNAQWWRFFSPRINMVEPMRMWDGPYDVWNDDIDDYEVWWFHDPGEKHLLGSTVIPAGQRGMQDIEDAIDALFQHPNVGPFMARRLIQRLVKSQPSPAYIERVARVFADNGSGVRGDLSATVKAILLDPEARDASWLADVTHGKLQEPYLRLVKLARAFDARSPSGWYPLWSLREQFGMQPMSSPSVFNFFQPDFLPSGELKDAGIVGPEFQLTNDDLLFRNRNQLYQASYNYFNRWVGDDQDEAVRSDYSEALAVADDPEALVRFLDQRLLQGTGQANDLATIAAAVRRISEVDTQDRVATAVYLLSSTAPAAILR